MQQQYFLVEDIAAISCKNVDLVKSSNVGLVEYSNANLIVKDELCVMDSCHKHFDFVYQPLINVNKTQTLDDERTKAINESLHGLH